MRAAPEPPVSAKAARAAVAPWMLRTCRAFALAGLLAPVLLTSCYKDEVDLAELDDNPFDPGFTGPAVFRFDTTYIESIQGTTGMRQVFQFRVNSSLFLAPQAYNVFVEDLVTGTTTTLSQFPVGSDIFRYYRLTFNFGQEVCVRLSLSNNTHTGRQETICGTLQ